MARWLAVTAADFRPRTVSGFGCSLARNFESIRRIGIAAVDVPQFFEHRRKGIEVFGYLGEMFPHSSPRRAVPAHILSFEADLAGLRHLVSIARHPLLARWGSATILTPGFIRELIRSGGC